MFSKKSSYAVLPMMVKLNDKGATKSMRGMLVFQGVVSGAPDAAGVYALIPDIFLPFLYFSLLPPQLFPSLFLPKLLESCKCLHILWLSLLVLYGLGINFGSND